MSHDDVPPRIGRTGQAASGTFHGPVTAAVRGDVQVITFTGAEEGDVLHAAGPGWPSGSIRTGLSGSGAILIPVRRRARFAWSVGSTFLVMPVEYLSAEQEAPAPAELPPPGGGMSFEPDGPAPRSFI